MRSVDGVIQLIRLGERPGEVEGRGAVCSEELADGPWVFDAGPAGYGPGASMWDVIARDAPRQGVLPAEYRNASKGELDLRIRAAKHALGERLTILGHFYQRDEVVQYADFVGDSFQLAQAAKGRPEAEAIVFCGVHFMAETADMLSRPEQAVILPNLAAGCSMADMADLDSVMDCWGQMEEVLGKERDAAGRVPVIPVTYMNSSAALKGFCGEHGGVVCTSSNAKDVLRWAFERGQRVLFFPDQHLGRNTAKAMGIGLEQMPVWDPSKEFGGNDAETLRAARVVLWHGFCSVHKRFTVEQIEAARRRHPGVRVIVHPECPMAVVDAADESGSTDYICKAIAAAPAGTVFAVGTEINLVQRLGNEHPEHTIFCLDSIVCPCSTMYRIHPGYLAWVLEALERGEVLNRITVPEAVAVPARVALERMLSLGRGVRSVVEVLMKPGAEAVARMVRMALDEDAPWGDVTSQAMLGAAVPIEAVLVAREAGVLSGEDVFTAAMMLTDAAIEVVFSIHDGERFGPGEAIAAVRGAARSVLQAERVGLNFVQRMSGIATLTARYVEEAAGTAARIVDTRKTTPGLRLLERYAVRCGGGRNHRFSLSDAVLVKDNHLAMVGDGEVTAALRRVRGMVPHTMQIEVEVDRLSQIEAVLAAGVGTILLDNFTLEELREGVRMAAGRALVEASGGMTLERVREIAGTGVDVISVGALTQGVRCLDLGLDVQEEWGA